jgi:hypothetical protein
MSRLIKVTELDGTPTWLNPDKIIKVVGSPSEKQNATTIYHEPIPHDPTARDGTVTWLDVEESPEEIARQVNQPLEVSLGSEPVDIAITEWPRRRLSINS